MTFILITKRRKQGWFQVNVYENHRVCNTETRGFDSSTGLTPKVQATLLVDPSWILGVYVSPVNPNSSIIMQFSAEPLGLAPP